ncbi:MAG: type I-B CRISPR-associated protein Cas7/Cst2/DevR [Clostridioides sp.]|jgi:CRISPR-associated protein Cst2|nr:type I-B CRISPR-associated protein Cas7/Cst2/DevR [Clostridioides sp.]
MSNKGLTITVVANMTSNYGEGLGNISSVQKFYKNKEMYSMRSRESLKNAIMVQSGMYDDLSGVVDGATQKLVDEEHHAGNVRALEGGYMNTGQNRTYIRNSSFYLTDAVSCESFVNDTRFHTNLYLAQTVAKEKGINLQEKTKEAGLMPYQYEYDKGLKVYSLTIDLDKIGKDQNFDTEASNQEKAERVNMILDGVENLATIVKGNLDNAEPIFVVGGISKRKTHYFENSIKVSKGKLFVTEDLLERLGTEDNFRVGFSENGQLELDTEIEHISVIEFFKKLREEVKEYFGV